MKSLYLPDSQLNLGLNIEISGDDYHHLAVVSRIKTTENVLLLNGSGVGFVSIVLEVTKKIIRLEIVELKKSSILPHLEVMILIPKKDSLDLMIKSCIELAVREIVLVRGEHSVEKLPEIEKIDKMIKQAIEQSNSFHAHIVKLANLKNFDFSLYSSVNILDIVTNGKTCEAGAGENSLLVVGPEGGFSSSERDFFKNLSNVKYITIKANILRSPTALIAGLGWLYAKN